MYGNHFIMVDNEFNAHSVVGEWVNVEIHYTRSKVKNICNVKNKNY